MTTSRRTTSGPEPSPNRPEPSPNRPEPSPNRPAARFDGRRIRVALIGAGAIARGSHYPALATLAAEGETEIVAAVDIAEGAVREFCAEAGIPHAYTDLDRMLAEQRPDLVAICTPPTVHREQTVAALRAGAWVWCEKPPVPTLADFDAVEAAEGTDGGPYAAIVFQHRFGSGTRHVRRLLAEGAMGRPLVAHCQTTWYRNADYYAVPWRGRWETEGGGPSMGHGIHQMDLLLDLLGPWSEVRAMAGRLVHDVETEDVSTALVRFASGAMATVVNSVLSPDEASRIRVDCERATVELTHLYGHSNDNWRIIPTPDVPDTAVAAWRDFGADVPSSHLAQLRELVASMRAGERPRSSGADGRTSLELITALYKAAFTDTTVRAGEIGSGDPYYTALHGGAPGWAPVVGQPAPSTEVPA
ncbi:MULTISPECIES: Gfo/Idh/MocA family protein [Streptomyces]|uniref:Gfo/Idh/MocA family oxidoreductase n=1 Tax=Streptomyces dengpaensis TaxID=2049881 RepID=A0ABN5IA91_9ACTN|nr:MULTISPECIES: Gfo/Idh/MocA family oxidoreductase [Streptomyces]AVH60119.1 gfo/Idh/MocA family oxidoreductase [Streptomyces dengpaensis]PIB04666.1 oxidoreductase [Streptomyces sp. HG99]